MSEREDPVLESVAEAVTDGMTVDWSQLRARNPDLAPDLEAMEEMANIAIAYRELREPDPER